MRKKFLSPEIKKEIHQMHHKNGYPKKKLAEMYDVSYNTIRRICDPKLYEKQKAENKEYKAKNKAKIRETEKNNYYTPKIKFHKTNDKAIIMKLQEQKNLNDYIRKLILKDLESEN